MRNEFAGMETEERTTAVVPVLEPVGIGCAKGVDGWLEAIGCNAGGLLGRSSLGGAVNVVAGTIEAWGTAVTAVGSMPTLVGATPGLRHGRALVRFGLFAAADPDEPGSTANADDDPSPKDKATTNDNKCRLAAVLPWNFWTVIGCFLRNCNVMWMVLPDGSRRNLDELRLSAHFLDSPGS